MKPQLSFYIEYKAEVVKDGSFARGIDNIIN